MKLRYSSLLAVLFFVAACSPSIEEITSTLETHLAGIGEDNAVVMNVAQTDKNVYSGQYTVAYNDTSLIAYPFTAIVKKGQVSQFFKETDDDKVLILTFSQNEDNATELNYTTETKAQYDERIRKEEEERARLARLAAQKRALSGSDLVQKGANYLLSGSNSIVQVISYRQSVYDDAFYKALFGQNTVMYVYKVLEATGLGTYTNEYDVIFRDGNVVQAEEHKTGIDDAMSSVASSLSYMELLKGLK